MTATILRLRVKLCAICRRRPCCTGTDHCGFCQPKGDA